MNISFWPRLTILDLIPCLLHSFMLLSYLEPKYTHIQWRKMIFCKFKFVIHISTASSVDCFMDICCLFSSEKVRLVQGLFTDLLQHLSEGKHPQSNIADGILFDIGASSMQFQDRRRGFGLKSKGPLDMRMSRCVYLFDALSYS